MTGALALCATGMLAPTRWSSASARTVTSCSIQVRWSSIPAGASSYVSCGVFVRRCSRQRVPSNRSSTVARQYIGRRGARIVNTVVLFFGKRTPP
jgi:hypothetical protein